MAKLDRDRLYSLNSRKLANCTMTVIDAVQAMTKEEQAVAIAAAFLLLSENLSTSENDLMQVADKIIKYTEGDRPEFAAIREYIKQELK